MKIFESESPVPPEHPFTEDTFKDLTAHCEKYKGGDYKRSLMQFTTTAVLFLASCTLMFMAVQAGNWLLYGLLLLPASGFLVRLFIVQHDCGHGSYFKSRKANDLVGRLVSVLTWTPYDFWRRTHNMHHAGSGNLDRRGYGGIETLTVSEYKKLSKRDQLIYRFYRNPFLLLVIGTPVFIIILQRFPISEPLFPKLTSTPRVKGAWRSVFGLNLTLVAVCTAMISLLGAFTFLVVYMPVLIITAWVGGWLFFIQHQFEETLWDKQEEWSFHEAAVMGSSYYDLPPVLQWFTGNIGLHHIHHLCSAIPNYRLQECLDERPDLKEINRMTLRDSLECVHLALWDESNRKMVSFKEANI